MRSSGRRRHSCATAGQTRGLPASRIRLSHHRSAPFLSVRDQLEICSTVAAIFSSRPNRVALSAWAITPTCLLSSSTMGFAAPDLVGRRSRPRCKSPPWRHVSGLKPRISSTVVAFRSPPSRYTWIVRSRSLIIPTRIRPLRLSPIGTEPISPFRFHSSPPWRQLVQRNTARVVLPS
jgi:hypothetical protein